MKLQLTGLRTLIKKESEYSLPPAGFKRLKVEYCAICKTDAKMWDEGHRDLVFPRVPGHEVAASDDQGHHFAIWPGQHCGKCHYCLSERENLCQEMKIMGFHLDGGFADSILVPEDSIIEVSGNIPMPLICFAEPVGCILNALEKVSVNQAERVVIYGAGTMGLMTALICKSLGAQPLLLEKDERKIEKASIFLRETDIQCVKETGAGEFEVAINACPDSAALALCITKLAKGGRLGYFSGITKNKSLETNLLNLVHYKELTVTGSYGLTRQNMKDALPYLKNYSRALNLLIEDIILPEKALDVLFQVLAGDVYRYVLDFSQKNHSGFEKSDAFPQERSHCIQAAETDQLDSLFHRIVDHIDPLAADLASSAQHKIDNKTKPLGSLGKLEKLAVQASLIQNNLAPEIKRKLMLVFAADHGVTEEGISAFPSEVTYQMLENFFNQGAAINVLCRAYGIDFKAVDTGVKGDFEDHPLLIKRKLAQGTRNFAIEDAMSLEEAKKAVEIGMDVFIAEDEKERVDVLGVGEIGIGNTTSATAIICAVTGVAAKEATGRGTGLDDKALKHKSEVIQRALEFHKPDASNGLEILSKVGGFELGGIAGAILAAASRKTIVVLDGVISTAAGLIAYLINPAIKDYLVSGHKSVEVAQKSALDYLGLEPVIDLDMRLGEGTGAAITIDLVETACKIMTEMASFDEAGVSNKV